MLTIVIIVYNFSCSIKPVGIVKNKATSPPD